MDQYIFKETTVDFLGLHLNESQINHPPAVENYLKHFDVCYHAGKYKSFDYVRLKIAQFAEVPVEYITLTNGCDHALELILSHCQNIYYPQQYHYSFLDKICKIYHINVINTFEPLPHTVVYYGNPNNPDGRLVNEGEINNMMSKLGNQSIIIIDETYIDYAGLDNSLQRLVSKYDNLFILRSFSKGFGLAGLRLGYIIGQTNYQYKINPKSFSMFTGVIPVVLDNYVYYKTEINALMNTKKKLVESIRAIIGDNIIDGSGNFFVIKCKDPALVASIFYTHSVLVRSFDTFIRITAPCKKDVLKIIYIIELAHKAKIIN